MTQQQNQKPDEEFKISGDQLLAKVKELINEGNVRRIIIKDRNDKILMEFPVTIGVIGAVFAPILAAVGAVAALVTECTIIVKRTDEPKKPEDKSVDKKDK
ncbi:MAG TPA: DUF4342 domain-containing protein [Verrucomicrobiae bacterium]|nr:DUF4342 domain-containing protein [Verrucomicrobiae bacterium]